MRLAEKVVVNIWLYSLGRIFFYFLSFTEKKKKIFTEKYFINVYL